MKNSTNGKVKSGNVYQNILYTTITTTMKIL